jgi:hypothetical protein
MSNYLISIPKNGASNNGTIHDPDSKLKVRVFDPQKSNAIPGKGEIMFFVTSDQETLAFETRGYKRHRKLLILQMISRYCIYLGLIEAQIHSACPF